MYYLGDQLFILSLHVNGVETSFNRVYKFLLNVIALASKVPFIRFLKFVMVFWVQFVLMAIKDGFFVHKAFWKRDIFPPEDEAF
jgi:hypothetical protein